MYLLLKGSAHSLGAPWFLVFVPSGSDLLSAGHSQGISCKEFSPAAEFKKGNTCGHALICTHKWGLSCLPTHPPPRPCHTQLLDFLCDFIRTRSRTRRLPFEGGNGMGYICSISYALCIHEIIIMQTDLHCAISCSC